MYVYIHNWQAWGDRGKQFMPCRFSDMQHAHDNNMQSCADSSSASSNPFYKFLEVARVQKGNPVQNTGIPHFNLHCWHNTSAHTLSLINSNLPNLGECNPKPAVNRKSILPSQRIPSVWFGWCTFVLLHKLPLPTLHPAAYRHLKWEGSE